MTNENIICKGINFGTENPCTGKLQIINSFDELRFVKKNHIILLNINLKYGHTQATKKNESLKEIAEIYSMIIKY